VDRAPNLTVGPPRARINVLVESRADPLKGIRPKVSWVVGVCSLAASSQTTTHMHGHHEATTVRGWLG